MMNSKMYIQIIAIVLSGISLHSCAIPTATTKTAEASIPASFLNNVQDTTTTARVDWQGFFADPYLRALIDSALHNNRELNVLLQRISMAQNEISVRKGEYLPTVAGVVAADVDKVGEYTRNGAVEHSLDIREEQAFPELLGNLEIGLVASWELDVWNKLRNGRKVAVLEYLASVEGRNFAITNLIGELANAYYELNALDNQLTNLRKYIDIQQDALETVKLLQQAGRENSLAVKRFEAEIQKNESEIYSFQQQIIETENEINRLIGHSPQPVPRESTPFMEVPPPMLKAGIPSQLLRYRPDIRQAELELAAADLNIQVARANFYPSFGLKVGLGFESFNPKFLLNPESALFSLAGDMVAPLVNRNAIKGAFRNANATQVATAYEYEQTILDAYVEVVNQLSNIANLESAYQKKQEQVESLTASITIANQLFQSARADYLEVLLTQREALEARTELIETKKEQMSASINLYRSLGGGWN